MTDSDPTEFSLGLWSEPKEQTIESLQQQLKVQQDAANHWFTEANNDHNRCVKLEQQLAECQAQGRELRFALLNRNTDKGGWLIEQALNQPSDSNSNTLEIPDVVRQRRWQREALLEAMTVTNETAQKLGFHQPTASMYESVLSKMAKELE